ncbi:cytochrome b [Ahniella affigens]|uniref:Cytochrome b n=1 Tax=Ahniella affigens TaxID=2021234 RepID=A0A2P1PVV0_9GAMM|nr:cytochrome b [Ahniella affigens]AVP98973.1 cytochrome b [Ahniella affigens]
MNSPVAPAARYSPSLRLLHASMATLILGNLWLGLSLESIEPISRKFQAFSWHKLIGLVVLALLVARLFWRWRDGAPALPNSLPIWQRLAAHIGHGLLYLLMCAVPVSGWLYHSASGLKLRWFGWLSMPNLIAPNPALKPLLQTLHVGLCWTLMLVLLLHVGAALKHHWWDRDLPLGRMFSWRG